MGHMPVALPEHTQGFREGHQILIQASEYWPPNVFDAVIHHYFASESLDTSLLLANSLLIEDRAFHDLIPSRTR